MIPKLYTAEEVSEILGLSTDTLARYRANLTGPQFLKVGDGGNIRYTEDAIRDYLKTCEQLPDPSGAATPAQMRAAVRESFAGVADGHRQRMIELAALDREDTSASKPYEVTVTRVGEPPNSQIEHINLCPPTPVVAPAAPHILQGR